MPRRESRRLLQEGRTRVVKHQVQDDPHNKRTWDEDQTWSALSIHDLKREVDSYSPKKLKRMLKYYRAFKMAKHRNVIVKELDRRRNQLPPGSCRVL